MRIAAAVLVLAAAGAWGQTKVMPTPPNEGINGGQPFDRKVPDPSVYAGRVYFVWGSARPQPDGVAVHSKYLPYSRDVDRTHLIEWYMANHPDWVMYQADRKTPAYSFVKPAGNPVPLDISNPEVREYYWATFVQPNIDAGYVFFALDNVELTNGEKRSGHFDKAGKWVQAFSGERVDDAYTHAVVDWIEYVSGRLHQQGIGVAANISFPLGKPALEPAMLRLVNAVDIWGDEQGFTRHNDNEISDEMWARKFAFVRSVEARRMHWAINEMTVPHLADASQKQIDWAVANYYLYRERGSLLTLTGAQEYGVYLDTPAMHIDLGSPLGAPEQSGGAWTRSYSKGWVAVNPSSKLRVTVRLPQGEWVDSRGQTRSGKIELEAVSAVMLMRK